MLENPGFWNVTMGKLNRKKFFGTCMALVCMALGACNTTGPKPDPESNPKVNPPVGTEYDWTQPGKIEQYGLKGYYAVVAGAKIEDNDEPEARKDAEQEALGKISQSISTQVETMYRKWVESIKKINNGTTLVDQLEKTKKRLLGTMSKETVSGVRYLAYKKREGNVYVLAVLPQKNFYDTCKNQTKKHMEEESFGDEAKEKMASRMDEICKKSAKERDSQAGFSFNSSTNIVVNVKQSTRVNINK